MPKKSGVLRVATCQFAVGADVRRNARLLRSQMRQAKRRRADIAHFPECALCGYPGADRKSLNDLDWSVLKAESESVCRLARELRLWVVFGSAHRLTGRRRPHNSLYVIDSRGRIVDRYDKRFCTGADLKHFSPGDHFVAFNVNGVRCGLLICYDVRFPELYREYRKRGVQCLFQSFHNARGKKGPTIWTAIMRRTVQAHAGINYFWVSANNSSAYYQSWPSIFVRPDGTVARSLRFHRAGVIVNAVDVRRKLYDASGAFRARAMRGVLHSGRLVRDPRSRNRRAL